METPTTVKGNKGERGEINIIKFLFEFRNDKDKMEQIFGYNSCINILDPSSKIIITDIDLIKNNSWKNKADIIINIIDPNLIFNISIKCMDGAPPTLLNHTALNAKCWKNCKY